MRVYLQWLSGYILSVGQGMIPGQLGEPKMLNLTGYLFTILMAWKVVEHDDVGAVFCGIAATAIAISTTFTTC